jgi:hypothetical protein
MAEPKPSAFWTFVLVLIVVAAGIGGAAFVYYENHRPPPSGPLTVQVGDNVTVNYIGLFGNSPQQGRVFDTSEYSVALNNVSWPKSLQYHSRGGSPSDYTPLGVYVGPNAPSSGYTFANTTFGGVVPGFWQGLLGLTGNRTQYVTVPPALGYSFVNASCIVTQPLVTTTPVVVQLTPSVFRSTFPNATGGAGTVFTDPVYGWPDLILTVNASTVTYENLPTLGMVVNPSGWPVVVSNLTASTITLSSRLSPSQAGLVLGHSSSSTCGATTFIVTSVNVANGTYVADYNPEVDGQTLIFVVTVVDIFRPA